MGSQVLFTRIAYLPAFMISVVLYSCGGPIPEDNEIRRALIAAAAAPADEVLVGVNRGLEGEAWVEAIPDQRLTLVLMAMTSQNPLCRDAGRYLLEQGCAREFEYDDPRTEGAVLAECFLVPRGGRRIAEDIALRWQLQFPGRFEGIPRPISAIWPEYITDVSGTLEGDTLVGIVRFEAPGCWRGQVQFVAQQSNRGWTVEGFELPGLGWSLRLEPSGLWRATRSDRPGRVPAVEEIEGRDGNSSAFDVAMGVPKGPIPVGFLYGGSIEVLSASANPSPSELDAGQPVNQPIVLIGVEPDLVIGDFLQSLAAVRTSSPSNPIVGLVAQGARLSDRNGRTFDYTANVVTDATPIRITDEIDGGPRYCISTEEISVSTGGELPLAILHERDLLDFAEHLVERDGELVFLINAQPEASYRSLEIVLDAIVRSGGRGAFLATERHRGVVLLAKR